MKTAIIIVNYKDADQTIEYIKVLENYQIIDKIVVVDNISPNKDYEKLRNYQNEKIDIICSEKNAGYSYGNNFGVKYLEKTYPNIYFDYIIISNPDIEIKEEAIKKTISFLESEKRAGVAAPRMYYKEGPARRSSWKERTYFRDITNSTRLTQLLFYPIFKKGEYQKEEYQKEVLKVDCISGAFFIIKHKVLQEIGYLDENVFLFYEEDILFHKLKEKGYETYSLNNLIFTHFDNQTIGKIYKENQKKDLYYASQKYYHRTYHKIGNLKLFVFTVLLGIRKLELRIEVPIKNSKKSS